MEKIIVIDGKPCRFKTSAGLPRRYREFFGRDLFVDMSKLKEVSDNALETGEDLSVESLNLFENMAYIMHKHGDNSQPNNVEEWLEQFNMLSIYNILPEIIQLWTSNNETLSVEKKNQN